MMWHWATHSPLCQGGGSLLAVASPLLQRCTLPAHIAGWVLPFLLTQLQKQLAVPLLQWKQRRDGQAYLGKRFDRSQDRASMSWQGSWVPERCGGTKGSLVNWTVVVKNEKKLMVSCQDPSPWYRADTLCNGTPMVQRWAMHTPLCQGGDAKLTVWMLHSKPTIG